MTKKKSDGDASKAGKKPRVIAPAAPAMPTPVGESAIPAVAESGLSVPDILPSSVSDTPVSPESPAAPENLTDALRELDRAAEAARAEPAVPVHGATGAEIGLDAVIDAMNAVPGESPKRKGGWPKGKPRKPSSAFPSRSTAASGISPAGLNEAQLRARVAELEAQQSEQVGAMMAVGFEQLAKIGFAIVARRQGIHWFLTKEEAQEIGAACGTAAMPFVSYIAPALPLLAAAGAVYGAVSARLEIDIEIESGKLPRVMPGGNNGHVA